MAIYDATLESFDARVAGCTLLAAPRLSNCAFRFFDTATRRSYGGLLLDNADDVDRIRVRYCRGPHTGCYWDPIHAPAAI